MSLEQIRTVVENFVNDSHNDLLVIEGDWGVGKTFFWDSLFAESRSTGTVERDYYAKVSVFGLNSLDELKSAIAVSRIEVRSNATLDSTNTSLAKLLTHVEKIPVVDKYVGGSIATLLHSAVSETLVCIDDIERKGVGLAIRDILGLASLLKEQRSCKVVLIINVDALEEPALKEFKLHGEKIIDRQVRFALTPEESFACVFKPGQAHYDFIKSCVLGLKIPNIRILQRISRFIEDMTPYLKGTETRTVEDVFRSLILYVWSYYGEANGAPPLKFVLNYSIVNAWLKGEKNIEETPKEKEWSKTLNSYNYFRSDEVDDCLSGFVQTGYINKPELTALIKKMNDRNKLQKRDASYHEAWAPYGNSFDDNESEFVDGLIRAFRANMEILAPRDLQSVLDMLRQLQRDGDADPLVGEYFACRNSASDIEGFKKFERSAFVNEITDEHLMSKLREIIDGTQNDKRTLAEVVRPIALKEGYDINDVRHMNSFSEDDYYDFFKTEKDNLYWCVKKCLDCADFSGDKGTYKSVGEKAKKALLRIAGESKFNWLRVSRIYKIDNPDTNEEHSSE